MAFRSKIRLSDARGVLSQLQTHLEPYCERMAICGSVRRDVAIVGDVELVVIPKMRRAGLFADNMVAEAEDAFDAMIGTKLLKLIRGGPKYKQFHVMSTEPPIVFDIWMVDPNGWGNQLAIRTGPWQYSKQLVTQRCKGGLLDDNYRVKDGRVWKYDDGGNWVTVAMPEESDFFELIKGGYRPPNQRRV